MQAHHETSTVVGKDIQASSPCSRCREMPVCAGDSHLKQTSGVAERFEFIHPRWQRLVWSLLFEQIESHRPVFEMTKEKRETDGQSGLVLPTSTITCCEPTRLKLKKPEPTKHTFSPSIPNIQIWATKIFTMLPAVKLEKFTLNFHKQIFKSGVIVESVCHNMHCILICNYNVER